MRPCEVKGRKATFHKWSHKAWVIDAGSNHRQSSRWPDGIRRCNHLEYEDGVVTECYPYEVKVYR